MATSSRALPEQSRPYQGYPFVNPVVIDVPTVDAATAARWANLPRRPIDTSVHRNPSRPLINDTPSIYVDIPAETGTGTGVQAGTSRLYESTKQKEDVPVVYIDVPDDIENNEDEISRNQGNRGQENPGFEQETILFDPFENRQIDVNKPRELLRRDYSPRFGNASPGSSAMLRPPHIAPEHHSRARPDRPAPLNIRHLPSSSSMTSPGLPNFMNKESQVYGPSRTTEDEFNLSPLPEMDFPEPPPAYSEVNQTTNGRVSGQANQSTPPRTVVVVPEPSPSVGLPSCNGKLLECHNCSVRVHTVVVTESGAFTHFVAIVTMILCLLPLTVMVYCTDYCKYRIHFCPNCRHSVGYEIPILSRTMVYNGQL